MSSHSEVSGTALINHKYKELRTKGKENLELFNNRQSQLQHSQRTWEFAKTTQ